jgi:hypothetical protein
MNAVHLLNCRKLDSSAETAGDIAKLYWDARFLMSEMYSNGWPLEEEEEEEDIRLHGPTCQRSNRNKITSRQYKGVKLSKA